MGTDALATIISNARAELADTATLFTTAIMTQAVKNTVADISRLSPREMFSIVTFDNLDVTASVLVADDDVYVYIRNSADTIAPAVSVDTPTPLDRSVPPIVKNSTQTVTYTEDVDYVVDYVLGRIKIISVGAIADAASLRINYNRSRLAFSLSALTDLIHIDRVMWMRAGKEQDFEAFSKWGDICWLTSKGGGSQSQFNENDQFYVWYHAEHAMPAAAGGSYPAYMDDVVVKGTVAYALFGKYRERTLQAITDVASARTALGLSDDDHAIIDTAITDIGTALAAMATALGLVNAFADTPFVDIETAVDATVTSAAKINTEVEALFDAPLFTAILTDITNDLIDAKVIIDNISGSVETAIDKVVEHLESDTLSGALPDSAERQLGAGDALINATNVGSSVAELYARYAEIQTAIAQGFINEATTRINQAMAMTQNALGRVQERESVLGEIDRRIAENNSKTNSYIQEATVRLEAIKAIQQSALSYGQEALNRLATVDRHLALGVLYIQQADGYYGAADRETAVADRLLLDARDRHADYWIHLTSRIENAKGTARASLKDLPRI